MTTCLKEVSSELTSDLPRLAKRLGAFSCHPCFDLCVLYRQLEGKDSVCLRDMDKRMSAISQPTEVVNTELIHGTIAILLRLVSFPVLVLM